MLYVYIYFTYWPLRNAEFMAWKCNCSLCRNYKDEVRTCMSNCTFIISDMWQFIPPTPLHYGLFGNPFLTYSWNSKSKLQYFLFSNIFQWCHSVKTHVFQFHFVYFCCFSGGPGCHSILANALIHYSPHWARLFNHYSSGNMTCQTLCYIFSHWLRNWSGVDTLIKRFMGPTWGPPGAVRT